MNIPRTTKGSVDMRAVKPAATRALNGIKSVAKGTASNLVNGGTGTYKRGSFKTGVSDLKRIVKTAKNPWKL